MWIFINTQVLSWWESPYILHFIDATSIEAWDKNNESLFGLALWIYNLMSHHGFIGELKKKKKLYTNNVEHWKKWNVK